MAIFRTVALAIAVAALLPPALPAHACDSNYPWLCKPVPSIEPSETTETSKAVKPLPITTQRNEARAAKPAKARTAVKSAKARVQRSAQARVAQARVKHVARKPPARRLVLRPRHHDVAAALPEDLGLTPNEPTRIAPPKPSERAQKPAVPSAVAEAVNDANPGFAAAWERSTGMAEPVGAASVGVAPVGAAPVAAAPVGAATATQASEPASEPAPVKPVPVASQSEVNEIDLAAADPAPQSDGSWLRGLFIAFGGVLALGSALRLFL
ncbi:MAG: hypothetical protein ACJ8FP_18495 [Xanthobacteraceae bacterium]